MNRVHSTRLQVLISALRSPPKSMSTARLDIVTRRVDGTTFTACLDLTRTHAGVHLQSTGLRGESAGRVRIQSRQPLLLSLHRSMTRYIPDCLTAPVSLTVNDPTTWRLPGPQVEPDPFNDPDLGRMLVGALKPLLVVEVAYMDHTLRVTPDFTLREAMQPLLHWLARCDPATQASPEVFRVVKTRGTPRKTAQ